MMSIRWWLTLVIVSIIIIPNNDDDMCWYMTDNDDIPITGDYSIPLTIYYSNIRDTHFGDDRCYYHDDVTW